MYRGMTTFKCSECGAEFSAPDIEYMATMYSTPQPCPKCNSRRTYPSGLFGWLFRPAYKMIWKSMENQ